MRLPLLSEHENKGRKINTKIKNRFIYNKKACKVSEKKLKIMEKISLVNDMFIGSDNRKSLIDLEIPPNFNNHLVLFVHGYMGFKDWGAWNQMQEFFTQNAYAFCKFNFSHNGGTISNGIDFPDLLAFSKNTYSKEVHDLYQVLNFLESKFDVIPKITVVGHSRGGGIALLCSGDKRIHSIVTLASISSIEKRFSDAELLKNWKENGVRYVENQRTKQKMPHLYLQAQDFEENKLNLSIEKACISLTKPILIIHGDEDTSVPISEGQEIANWTNQKLTIIQNADHVFGAFQQWQQDVLPEKLKEVSEKILSFISE